MRAHRWYTEEQQAQAVGLALTVGPRQAGLRLGIPVRTVTNWMHRPGAVLLRERTREDVAAKLWEAVVLGTDEIVRRMKDPKARLSDIARALEVVAQQHALMTGGATANVHSIVEEGGLNPWDLTSEEKEQLLSWLQTVEGASDEELREMRHRAIDAGMTDRAALVHGEEASDGVG